MPILTPGQNETGLGHVPQAALAIPSARGFRAPECLSAVGRAGFPSVELDGTRGGLADPRRMVGLARTNLIRALRGSGLLAIAVRMEVPLGLSDRAAQRSARESLLAAVDLAQALESPLAVVQSAAGEPRSDASGYALDVIYDADTALTRSGVRLALMIGGPVLAQPEERDRLLAQAPATVGLALEDADLDRAELGPEAVGRLAAQVWHVRLHATDRPQAGLRLDNEERARRMLTALARAGYSGPVAVAPEVRDLDRKALADLWRACVAFLPTAFAG